MSRYHSYLNSAVSILKTYSGEEPFASFLKKYFAAYKKFGSKDRKHVSHLCYCFFRAAPPPSEGGIGEASQILEEKILAGLFLCSSEPNEILEALKPGWNEKVNSSIKEKFSIVNFQLSIENIFPWKEELNRGIDHQKFCESFLTQPDLFLRLRPGKEETVKQKLLSAGIQYEFVSENCLALSNSSKIDSILELDKEAVIQDYSSQQVGRFLSSAMASLRKDNPLVWDCCAGSGGKSIMAYDINPNIELTVSDIRESILNNLKKRFASAGITNYKSRVMDLSPSIFNLQQSLFDIILCDVPCTGSGTWGRTPEQLHYFNPQSIEQYSQLQKQIVSNTIPHLLPGAWFLYITCSVFKKENEENVEFIKNQFHLELIKSELLKGYDKKADTMFAALFRRPL